MLAMLVAIILCLGGIIISNIVGGVDFEGLPQLPIAATLATAFIALYVASHYGVRSEGRTRLVSATGLACLAVLGLAFLWYHPPVAISGLLAALPQEPATRASGFNSPASVRIRRAGDGSFRAHADVNGAAVSMLIDTGSASIVLRGSDAENAGIKTNALVYDTPLTTANGTNYVGAARIKSLQIGMVTAADVEAFVAKPGTLNESLLGMNFLRRLGSYEVAGDFVTLRQ